MRRVRSGIPLLALLALCLGAERAEAQSCSSFVVIKSYDAAKDTIQVVHEKGNMVKFFPKPEGAPRDASKIPSPCKGNVTKSSELVVKSTGGRMTMTQVRTNFEGKMLNDLEDPTWLSTRLSKLAADGTQVVVVIRPGGLGKDAPLGITTLYLPITDEELAEIQRLENQAEDI
jgi:hypothetical protein